MGRARNWSGLADNQFQQLPVISATSLSLSLSLKLNRSSKTDRSKREKRVCVVFHVWVRTSQTSTRVTYKRGVSLGDASILKEAASNHHCCFGAITQLRLFLSFIFYFIFSLLYYILKGKCSGGLQSCAQLILLPFIWVGILPISFYLLG